MNRRARVLGIGHRGAPTGVARIAVLGLVAALLGPLVIHEAEAASFYTRKRVNGVWVTGQFAKGGSAYSSRRHRGAGRTRLAMATAAPKAYPLPPASVPETPVRGGGPETTSSVPRVFASLTEPFPEPTLADERLIRLKEALTAHATVLVARTAEPDGPRTASLAGPAEASPERGRDAGSAPSNPGEGTPKPVAPALAPRSVSYDFETGIKTTVFATSVVREPFDVAAMRALTPRVPAR